MKKSRTRSVKKQKHQKNKVKSLRKNKVKSLRKNKVKSIKKKKKHFNKKSTRRNRKKKGGMLKRKREEEQREKKKKKEQEKEKEKEQEQEKEQEDCPICLQPLNNKNELETTECNHTFHKKCLHTWCMTSETCPLCRNELPETCRKLQPIQNEYKADDYWIDIEDYPEEITYDLKIGLVKLFKNLILRDDLNNRDRNSRESVRKREINRYIDSIPNLTFEKMNMLRTALLDELEKRLKIIYGY